MIKFLAITKPICRGKTGKIKNTWIVLIVGFVAISIRKWTDFLNFVR